MASVVEIIHELSHAIRDLSKRVRKLETQVFSSREVACRVYNSANFVHNSSGNWLPITFDSERRDVFDMHSVSANTSIITFALEGWYLVGGHIAIESNSTGLRAIRIILDGSTVIGQLTYDAPGTTANMSISALYYFAATNYVELQAYQNSGGNLNVLALGNYSPEFWAIKVG